MRTAAILALVAALGLAACVSPEERARRIAEWEAGVKARFVGQSVDTLILALGPPDSSFELSDGRDVLQYVQNRTSTTGGDTWTRYDQVTRTRSVRDRNGVVRTETYTDTIPVTEVTPIRTYHMRCVRRFVVGADNVVRDFAWEGNACF